MCIGSLSRGTRLWELIQSDEPMIRSPPHHLYFFIPKSN